MKSSVRDLGFTSSVDESSVDWGSAVGVVIESELTAKAHELVGTPDELRHA